MTITVDGIKLHVEEFGGTGLPVLFVHGFPLSGEMWHSAIDALLKQPGPARDCRMIVPDLRGHGRSEASDAASMTRYADDLVAVLDALGERRPVVFVGLSMGAMLGFEMFRRHRPRLRALVLVCTRANAESPEGVARRETVAQTALAKGAEPIADDMIGKLLARNATSALRQKWHEIMRATPPRGVAAAARALGARPDSLPTLREIDLPTLVVAGEEDTITPLEELRRIHDGVRGSRMVVIPGAAHLVPAEQPEAFAAELAAFLRGL